MQLYTSHKLIYLSSNNIKEPISDGPIQYFGNNNIL